VSFSAIVGVVYRISVDLSSGVVYHCGMTIKASEYYKGIEACEADAESIKSQGERLVVFGRNALLLGRRLRDEADANGLPADAREQLDAYRKMLDDGPPDEPEWLR
jgi:hypothetical protein